MNYQNHYDLLISRGQSRILEGYSEKHHIIPKCIGGDNSKENLVRLTPEEHYLAHQLLVKIYPEIPGLVYAARMMTWDKFGYRQNNKSFGWIRRKYSIVSSELMTGRTKDTHEYIRLSAEKMTGRTKENNTGKKSAAEKMTGRTKENNKGMKIISEKMTGRTKETHEHLKVIGKKNSEKLTGRTKETHEYLRIKGEKQKKLTKIQEQEVFQMRNSGISGKEVYKYLKTHDINLSYSSISAIYNRIKLEKTK